MGHHEQLLEPLKKIAKQAADAIMRIYQTDFDVQIKSDKTPVTEADFAAHKIISQGLSELIPGLPVLSEEGDIPDYSERKKWSSYWLVDPMDGTREFVNRSGQFTVNIALIENQQAVVGVIYAPVYQCCYFAVKDRGAYRINDGGVSQQIQIKPWAGEKIRIACSRVHRSSWLERLTQVFKSYELVPLGSSLKSCYVADGQADIYLRMGPTCEWDTAAAQIILEQAGGALVDLDMQPLRYNSKESLLNPHFMSVGDTDHDWQKFLPTPSSHL